MIKEKVNDSNNPFLKVFEYENKGYIEISDIYDRIEIVNIFVNEQYRNQKIASNLMNYIIDYAKNNNKTNITLEVNSINKIAIHLYEKFGFKKVAVREKYYNGIDGILMEKVI
ncbi:MAG TPA: GNAT family N-acetyltransferase [Bacilli bacterium]|nr:GNAT family N-acetyltransferase [Bacilli bacterium]